MHRFKATIEFNDYSNNNDSAKLILSHYLRDCPGACIESIEKISISHEEAIKQIKEVVAVEKTHGCVSASKIESILQKVIY